MPAELRKTLIDLTKTRCFLDEILTVGCGTVNKNLNRAGKYCLDDENLGVNLSKSQFTKNKIEWLGYNFSKNCIRSVQFMTSAIKNLRPPNALNNRSCGQ